MPDRKKQGRQAPPSSEEIIAMAVAAMAEETGESAERLRVVSFREVQPSGLERYLAGRKLPYHKYQLGE